jgi:hypothetical protein
MESQIELSNFTAGELSPRLKGRFDQGKYYNGCDTLVNFVVMPQGGATKRPGTEYIADARDQIHACRLRRFVFSTVQAYMLEFSDLHVRPFANDAPVLNAGVPVDVGVPYTFDELDLLNFTQSADTLYIWHPRHPPATLTRSSHVNWSYAPIVWRDGPYEDVNTTATTLTPSGTAGPITIDASAVAGINKGQGFLPGDVGRLIRIRVAAVWGWVQITGVNSPTQVTANVMPEVIGGAAGAAGVLDGTAATPFWRLGMWSPATGYPYTVAFWQQRLISGGYDGAPNAVVGSVVGDFTNMAPSEPDGTVTEAHAFVWRLDDEEVNAIRWLSPAGAAHTPQLGIGTSGSEQIMQAASASDGLSPISVQAYRETAYGSAAGVNALRIGKSILFMDRSARKLREWSFFWQLDGYDGPDATQFSEHITRGPPGAGPELSGLKQTAYQAAPHQVIWAARNDGMLLGFTYDRTQTVFAPHRHRLGGNYYGGPPLVESLDVIPAPDGSYDELWLAVLRTIDGVPKRFIEVLTRYFDGAAQEEAFFSDAGLSSELVYPNATLTISGLSNTAPETKRPAFTGEGLFTTDVPAFAPALVGGFIRVNGGKARITAYVSSSQVRGTVIESLLRVAPAPPNAWSATPVHTSFTGLDHLNGEDVAILGDGASFKRRTVAGGSVTLDTGKASFANIGLPYQPVLVTMPWENPKTPVATQGKAKRPDTLWIRFHETLGCLFGRRVSDPMTFVVTDKTERMLTRNAADAMGQAPPLFSGMRKVAPQGNTDLEGQILITQDEPLPLTVLAIVARAEIPEMQR